jgi:uncharacterized protein (DUF983 family)
MTESGAAARSAALRFFDFQERFGMTDEKRGAATPIVSPVSAGLRCRCPRCGQGPLLKGLLELRESCPNCGLSYAFADAGDGPAVFVILIVGFIVCGAALWTEVRHTPPMWLHAVLWMPLTLLLAWLLLPRLKGLLVALQYRNKAELGRLARDDETR